MPKKIKTESVESIEKFLKNARNSKRLSLEDAAHDTRIRKIHLKQFETEVPNELDVYQIGYLRLYSRYLGVDIQPYLDARKAQAIKQPNRGTVKKSGKLSHIMKRGLDRPRTLVISLTLMLALTYLMIAQWKNPTETEQAPSINSLVDTQTDKHTHVLTNYSGKVKVIANIATVFTLLDPVHNNTIAKGTLKAGEELPLPDAESVIIKTTIPAALDIQQVNKTPDTARIEK